MSSRVMFRPWIALYFGAKQIASSVDPPNRRQARAGKPLPSSRGLAPDRCHGHRIRRARGQQVDFNHRTRVATSSSRITSVVMGPLLPPGFCTSDEPLSSPRSPVRGSPMPLRLMQQDGGARAQPMCLHASQLHLHLASTPSSIRSSAGHSDRSFHGQARTRTESPARRSGSENGEDVGR